MAARSGRPQEAITYLKRATELKPDSGQIHINFAAALISLGKTPEAIGQVQLAIACNPKDSESHA